MSLYFVLLTIHWKTKLLEVAQFYHEMFCLLKYKNLSLFNVSKAKVVSPQDHLNCINIHNGVTAWSQRDTSVISSVPHGICSVDTMFELRFVWNAK